MDFASIEIGSYGRGGARARLAAPQSMGESDAARRLLAAACRLSLRHDGDAEEFERTLAAYDDPEPLWPALAKHLARQADEDDEKLLRAAAEFPERYCGEGYLQSGLRFIVRGDVRVDDWYLQRFPDDAVLQGLVRGRLDADGAAILTLDEIAAAYGVDVDLPYLEPMEDELEVDWEEE